jgi:RPA family protein
MEDPKDVRRRQIAFKLKIKDIVQGRYVKTDGEWEPNYVLICGKKISRANIIGIVVSNEQGSAVIEDGSGMIEVRAFEGNPVEGLAAGDVVLVIGRPREFANAIFIVPEIIRKTASGWLEHRNLEAAFGLLSLENAATAANPVSGNNAASGYASRSASAQPESREESVIPSATEEDVVVSKADIILNTIRSLDKGDGADIEDVIKVSAVADCEKLLGNMLKDGDIFQVRHGRLKTLD